MRQPDSDVAGRLARIGDRRSMARMLAPDVEHLQADNGFEDLPASDSLVSVIVPSYAHGEFVETALESIALQTYGQLELILIDDQSPDDTFTRALGFLRDSTIPYCAIRRLRSGLETNLNAGIQLARGGWIALLASDDVFLPDCFEALLATAARSGADVAIGAVDEISRDGAFKMSRVPDLVHLADLPREALRRALLEGRRAMLLQGMLLARRVFADVGLFDPEVFASDLDYMLRMVSRNVRLAFLLRSVALHRDTRAGVRPNAKGLKSALSLAYIERYHASARAVVRRHARSVREARRPIAFLRLESGTAKLANGYLLQGLIDVVVALMLSPWRVARLAYQRLAGRIAARRHQGP